MMLRKLSIVLAAISSMALWQSASADAWVFSVTPQEIRTSGVYSVITFSTTQALTNPASCSGAFYVVNLPSQMSPALAILLSAHATGANVSIYVLSGSCDSKTNGIVVTDVMTSP